MGADQMPAMPVMPVLVSSNGFAEMLTKVLQHLVVAIGYRFDHALHVALFRLHQAKQILLCGLHNRVVAGSKVPGKWSRKPLIVAAQLPQRFVIANPIFLLVSSVICSRSYLSREVSLI